MKKKMYKSKKQWVVVGVSGLALLNAGALKVAAEEVTPSALSSAESSIVTTESTGALTDSTDSTAITTESVQTTSSGDSTVISESIDNKTNDIIDIANGEEVAEAQVQTSPVIKTEEKVLSATTTPVQVEPTVSYNSHVQNVGWQQVVSDSQVSGSVGLNRRIEAIKINLTSPNITGNISYATLVRGKGWQTAVSAGQISGTVGTSTPIDALSINLTGDLQTTHDIYYRVYVQGMGWLKWASNGAYAGTSGLNKYLEAYEIQIVRKGQFQESPSTSVSIPKPQLSYQVIVENTGWQTPVSEGQTSGTVGKSKQIEAVKIGLNSTENGNLIYKTHVQDKGWLPAVTTNEVSGTINLGKQVEAIQIALTGTLAQKYDIFYRAHVQNIGWQAWTSNNKVAGTIGKSNQIEAIEIKLVEKVGVIVPAPQKAFVEFKKPILSYKTYVEKAGWQSFVLAGQTSGTVGQSKQIEGLLLSLDSSEFGNVFYQVHVQNVGWMTGVSTNQIAGLVGKGLQIEAIKVDLTGFLSEKYDIYYRSHVQNVGWQNWRRNNDISGTIGQSRQIEAIEISIVEKPKTTIALIQNQVPFEGRCDVLIVKGTESKAISKIRVAAWSKADQSNLYWYTAAPSTNGETIVRINQVNHKKLVGDYTIHTYVYYADGSVQKIEVGTSRLAAPLITPYYNQRDYRWGSKVYGKYTMAESGCVPTSLAMIFSSLSGNTILPPHIADYLYNNTREFDKDFIGTSVSGILTAVKHYGYEAKNLVNQSALIAELKAGHHVAGAVQNNKFVLYGSHEMVFKGYSNGNTYVYDPYTQELCGWYPVASLWNERSRYADDNEGIAAPFFRISNLPYGGAAQKSSVTTASVTNQISNNTFLEGIKAGAIASWSKGVLPSITAAQAILESNWGTSTLGVAPNYNLFGIKAGSDWTGQTVKINTKEYINGKYVDVLASFRKYSSWSDSIRDHATFFTSTPYRTQIYSDFLWESDYKLAAQKLLKAGYATDPEYANKLIKLVQTYGLQEWDKL